MKKIILMGFFISIISVSCKKDYFKVHPHAAIADDIAYSDDHYATQSINGIYGKFLGERYFNDYAWRYTNWGPDGVSFRGDYKQAGTMDADTYDMWRKWAYKYGIIRVCNIAISLLTGNENVSADLRKRLIGEAKFIRGFCYFELWANFGEIPIVDKPISIEKTFSLSRNSNEEVVAFLIKDFTEAKAALPVDYTSSASNIGRATSGAAQAMIGKTYLYDEQWDKSWKAFEKLMLSPYHYALPSDFRSIFQPENDHHSGVIWNMEAIDEPDMGSAYDFRFGYPPLHVNGWYQSHPTWSVLYAYTNKDGSPIYLSDMPNQDDFSSSTLYSIALEQWYIDTYKDADDRLKATVVMPGDTVIAGNGGKYVRKYPLHGSAIIRVSQPAFLWRKYTIEGAGHVNRKDSPLNPVFIRYADVLLMYAEAKNEASGPSQEIYDAVNEVRARGHVPPIYSLTKDELRREIRLERFREFAGEGILFFDVRRWRLGFTNDSIFGMNNVVERDVTGDTLLVRKFPKNYHHFPVPNDNRNLNPNLTQNPGY